MKTIEISYNPYKMKTKMYIDKIDVCQNRSYEKFKGFIEDKTPLQTWIEPIKYLDWAGFVNEVSDPEYNDEVTIVFSGRVIDFEDLKRSITDQNEERSEETRVIYKFQHKKVLDDKELSQNIEEVVNELMSDRFRKLVSQRTTAGLTEKYNALEENYRTAKDNLFCIVLAGAYNSGKSTLLNTLMRHDILPTSSSTCTSKNCRIRHNAALGTKVSLTGYGDLNEENGKEPVIIPERIYDTDAACATAFLEICPIAGKDAEDKYSKVETIELGIDLSHLYPDNVSKDKFTIVLIDTPGMDSAQSSENGLNKHAEIALEAISMESKPMIILCVDANYYDNKSIGEFMREIIIQSKEDSGFNDRFLFLMNKSDAITYKQGETAENVKMTFSEYLTDSSKWNIKCDEDEIKQLAENASHFVPRVFMTASLIAFAIQKGAMDYTEEELNDPCKEDLYNTLDKFKEKICGPRKRFNYYLSRYCDIPNYRKDELEQSFEEALNNQNDIQATELQCGIVSVESAIKDYIARYAYPIKVRDLLDTFEDILEDVNGFTNDVFAKLKERKKELGEKGGERKEASKEKRSAEKILAALEKAKNKIEKQKQELNKIRFDSKSLNAAISNFQADIEDDEEIKFIRRNPIVQTGQRSRSEVENEIDTRITHIKNLFDCKLRQINEELENIKAGHDKQINKVISILQSAVAELERSGLFNQGKYNFTDTVFWKMNFSKINSDNFASDMKKRITDKSIKEERVANKKKAAWKSSWNPFKKLGSLFMDDYKTETKPMSGYYETSELRKKIDSYFLDLHREIKDMENMFMKILDDSKTQVNDLIDQLQQELYRFLADIRTQDTRIEMLSKDIGALNSEIRSHEETLVWLSNLRERIKGE